MPLIFKWQALECRKTLVKIWSAIVSFFQYEQNKNTRWRKHIYSKIKNCHKNNKHGFYSKYAFFMWCFYILYKMSKFFFWDKYCRFTCMTSMWMPYSFVIRGITNFFQNSGILYFQKSYNSSYNTLMCNNIWMLKTLDLNWSNCKFSALLYIV